MAILELIPQPSAQTVQIPCADADLNSHLLCIFVHVEISTGARLQRAPFVEFSITEVYMRVYGVHRRNILAVMKNEMFISCTCADFLCMF
jgi:hypothetical protein